MYLFIYSFIHVFMYLLFNWQRTRSLNLNDRLVNDVEMDKDP